MKYNRLFLPILFLLGLMLLVSGCGSLTKHEVLSFFFTGVPSPEEEREKQQRALLAQTAGSEKSGPQTRFSTHSYFTKKKCGECHQVSSVESFGGTSRSGMPTVSFGGEANLGKTRLPLKKMCVSCHENRSAAFASTNNLWLHAVVIKGNCIICHEPHQSKYPDLLKDEPDKLCTMCHSEGLIRLTKSHQELKGCLECHTPHLGKDKYLLIKDYKEVRQLPKPAADISARKDGFLE